MSINHHHNKKSALITCNHTSARVQVGLNIPYTYKERRGIKWIESRI